MIRLEAGIDRQHSSKTRQQKPRADQQHEGKGYLEHYEAPPENTDGATRCAAPTLLGQHRRQIDAEQMCQRDERKPDSDRCRDRKRI